jgi:hypothetical protein
MLLTIIKVGYSRIFLPKKICRKPQKGEQLQMSQFYELIPKRNMDPLTKRQICDLCGGNIHGETIFVVTHLVREFAYAVYEVKVKNQRRSQKHPYHPEGYLWLKSDLYGSAKNFRYDIASETIKAPLFEAWPTGKLSRRWHRLPAVVLQPPTGSDDAILLMGRARDTEGRERLLKTLTEHPDSLTTATELLVEAKGLQAVNRSGTDPAERTLRCLHDVDAHLADDLREAILAKSPLPTLAQAILAAA